MKLKSGWTVLVMIGLLTCFRFSNATQSFQVTGTLYTKQLYGNLSVRRIKSLEGNIFRMERESASRFPDCDHGVFELKEADDANRRLYLLLKVRCYDKTEAVDDNESEITPATTEWVIESKDVDGSKVNRCRPRRRGPCGVWKC